MKNLILTLLLTLMLPFLTEAQTSQESWDTYIASYDEGKSGITTLRMDLINSAPIKNLGFVLVTGVGYETTSDDGFPEQETLQTLYNIEDELIRLVAEDVESLFVGSLLYDKERLGYFYLEDTTGIRDKLNRFYKSLDLEHKPYINLMEDIEWEAYKDFLYPNKAILNYMSDQKVVNGLTQNGDDLTKERRVDHWLYFSILGDLKNCRKELVKLGYKVESSDRKKNENSLYKLQVWHVAKVDFVSINSITTSLLEVCDKYNGNYDGWETFVVKD